MSAPAPSSTDAADLLEVDVVAPTAACPSHAHELQGEALQGAPADGELQGSALLPGEAAATSSAEAPSSSDLAEQNEKSRSLAAEWLRSQPLARLMAIKLFMRPLSELLTTYVKRSGQAWTKKQAAQTAKALLQGTDLLGSSSYKEYLSLTAENTFFQRLKEVVGSAAWNWLPSSSWTLSFESLLFRLGSRMGCAVYQLLQQPTSRSPHPLFKLTVEPTAAVARHLQHMGTCCQDSFTQSHLGQYPGDALVGADSLAVLEAVAVSASTETVGVEWGHGRVHRLITKSSVQTHTPTTMEGWYACRHSCTSPTSKSAVGLI